MNLSINYLDELKRERNLPVRKYEFSYSELRWVPYISV
jgi:hypothetical protein